MSFSMVHEKKRVAILSVIAAVFLTAFKLVVGLITGSLGILSEALHSGIDLVAAVITFFQSVFPTNLPIKNIISGTERWRTSLLSLRHYFYL